MPGSPPTNRAEPATSPPPQTRSNSLMPVVMRGCCASVPSRGTKDTGRPPVPDTPFGAASLAASSVMLFQAPQSSHLPAHLRWLAPHC
jgi:hypothetical protein